MEECRRSAVGSKSLAETAYESAARGKAVRRLASNLTFGIAPFKASPEAPVTEDEGVGPGQERAGDSRTGARGLGTGTGRWIVRGRGSGGAVGEVRWWGTGGASSGVVGSSRGLGSGTLSPFLTTASFLFRGISFSCLLETSSLLVPTSSDLFLATSFLLTTSSSHM